MINVIYVSTIITNLVNFSDNLTQARVYWEEETSNEKILS